MLRGADAISARFQRDIGYLSRLSRELRDVLDACTWIASVKQAWHGEGTGALFEYARGLAFATPEYRPTPDNLRRIITTLQSRLAVRRPRLPKRPGPPLSGARETARRTAPLGTC